MKIAFVSDIHRGRQRGHFREQGLPWYLEAVLSRARNLKRIIQSGEEPARSEDAFPSPLLKERDPEKLVQALIPEHLGHSRQVARLALLLYDQLQAQGCLALGREGREWLRCGALLHDIGWTGGQKAHHKRSLGMIREMPLGALFANHRDRMIVASIARYHRKALPSSRHSHYASLSKADRKSVEQLGGILRVADGLDVSHRSVVRDLEVRMSAETVVLHVAADRDPILERSRAVEKGTLFEKAFGRNLVVP
ncbi:MAG: HD domain-containing protein [Synergistales bacterium]|nr:HD domain-containing protein [Synergistales bacterium]